MLKGIEKFKWAPVRLGRKFELRNGCSVWIFPKIAHLIVWIFPKNGRLIVWIFPRMLINALKI